MKLREYLETAPDDRILYVGAFAAFFAAGYKNIEFEYEGDVYPSIYDQIEQENDQKMASYEVRVREREKLYANAVSNYGDDSKEARLAKMNLLDPFVPFLDREVIETWERQEEDALNVRIDGEEQGKIWSIHEKDKVLVNYNAEVLVGSVIKEIVQDYRVSFGCELQTMKDLLDRLKGYMDQSRGYESYIRYLCGSEAYVDNKGREHKFPTQLFALSNPEMIIDLARRSIVETLMEQEEKEKKRKEKRKAMEKRKANETP